MDAKLTEMLRRTEWPETEIIKDGDALSCKIDGEIVKFTVRIHPKEICVRLLRDDIGMTASAKLMLMAPVTYTTETGTRRANDYGIMRLRDLMVGLYHDYQIISSSQEQIKGVLPEFLCAKDECKRTVSDLNGKKRDLKKDFKQGRLSQKSYMEQLNDIKEQVYAHQHALTETFGKIFKQVLSGCSHCDDLIGAIESLSGSCLKDNLDVNSIYPTSLSTISQDTKAALAELKESR